MGDKKSCDDHDDDDEILMSCCKMGGFKRSIAERRGLRSDGGGRIMASPCLTIPDGISPTALLDSPIMLPNSQALPSPTTGTFLLEPDAASSFNSTPLSSASHHLVSNDSIMAKGGISDCQTLVPVQPPLDFAIPAEFPRGHATKSEVHSYDDVKMIHDVICNANNAEIMQICGSEEAAAGGSSISKRANKDMGHHHLVEGDNRETPHSMGVVRTSEDGYNWRKYGQKQVKGSEYPRSYYKCTHPNCQVKKKVERSLDGQITEIIYKGGHNHGKPHPNRRSTLSTDEMSNSNIGGSSVKVEGGPIWRNIQSGLKDIKHNLDWKADNHERTSPTSVVTQLSDPMSTNKGKPTSMFESEDIPELSSTLACQDDDEDGATQGSISLEEDGDDEESESKRRKKESCVIESNFASRAVREPRVVIQIETEVDILDDGYRWRKYGQKVVKGNPNPRSYYKCTSAGCPVRKHVERASHDLKYVITTYEGKHNHEVPTARSNNQTNSSSANGLPGNISIPKPDTRVQHLAPIFDKKPEFLRPSFVANFSDDIKFGSSSVCPMKYFSLSSAMPYGPYEQLTPDPCATPQDGSISSDFPDFPMSLPLNLPSSGNFAMAGLNFNYVKPMPPIQSFLPRHQQLLKEVDTAFLRPKQEHKDNIMYDILDHATSSSSSSSSSVYHRVIQNFPS